MAGQVSDADTAGLTMISWPFVDVSDVTNPGPRSSRNRMSTVLTFGRQSASTVATDIARGSNTSDADCARATASSTQSRAWAYGESSSSPSVRPSPS
jgi:hypothetical protein